MTVSVYPLNEQSSMTLDDVELSLIRILKPLLNVRGKK